VIYHWEHLSILLHVRVWCTYNTTLIHLLIQQIQVTYFKQCPTDVQRAVHTAPKLNYHVLHDRNPNKMCIEDTAPGVHRQPKHLHGIHTKTLGLEKMSSIKSKCKVSTFTTGSTEASWSQMQGLNFPRYKTDTLQHQPPLLWGIMMQMHYSIPHLSGFPTGYTATTIHK
jgi:hypothetical protein